jgi:hypothetical protein
VRPVLDVDDLPGFLEHPPGSPLPETPVAATTTRTAATADARVTAGPVAASGATVSGATAVGGPTGAGRHAAGELSAGRTVLAMVVAAAVLVAIAVLIALVSGGDAPADPAGGAPGTPTPGAAPARTPDGVAEEAVEVPAGALAARSVPLGEDGMAARATFGSVLLAERAVGVTVTSPALSVSTDGEQALAHLRLPTSNCLTRRPPTDPASAGCARGATEFADLAGPALRWSRDGDRLELTGRFPTYTRPAGRPAAYTGRSYRVSASLEADGPARDGRAPATGALQLGPARSATTGDPALNVLELRG